MASLVSPSDRNVATLQPTTDKSAAERSGVNGSFSSLRTSPTSAETKPSSIASLLRLSEPVDPKLQAVFDWIESPSFQSIIDWIEFPLAPKQFELLKYMNKVAIWMDKSSSTITIWQNSTQNI
jgi:hypothetical protein